MKRLFTLVLLFVAAAYWAVPTSGQSRWDRSIDHPFSVEVAGSFNHAVNDFPAADLGAGFGGEIALAYRVLPAIDVFGGWGYQHFNADESIFGSDLDLEETGYFLGLGFEPAVFGSRRLQPYVRAAGVYDHVELEDAEGEIIEDTGKGWGYRLGLGVDYAITEHIRLRSGLRFLSLDRDATVDETSGTLELRYVSARIGLAIRF